MKEKPLLLIFSLSFLVLSVYSLTHRYPIPEQVAKWIFVSSAAMLVLAPLTAILWYPVKRLAKHFRCRLSRHKVKCAHHELEYYLYTTRRSEEDLDFYADRLYQKLWYELEKHLRAFIDDGEHPDTIYYRAYVERIRDSLRSRR